jgi:NitT/TauT family transport system ATP-binding protein
MTAPSVLAKEHAESRATLIVDDLHVSYESVNRTVNALAGVNFAVADGEFVAIIGPSGCGKSTLLNTIMGLQPASKGDILVAGKSVRRPEANRATVFQEPRLLPWRTVLRNVSLGLEAQGIRRSAAKVKALREIERVGLEGFQNFYPGQLSGGMQQRVNLARALAVSPALLLLDEPFAALDAQTREQMQSELMRIWQQSRATTLFVTHQIDEALFLADRVLVLSSRPGHISREFTIQLERPRRLAMKRTAVFHEYEDALWSEIDRVSAKSTAREAEGEA